MENVAFKFDVADRLTEELIFGNYHEGKIPKHIRRKDETKAEAYRRRVGLLHNMKKFPGDVKAALEFCRHHLGHNDEFQRLERNLPIAQHPYFKTLSLPLRINVAAMFSE